MKITRSSKTGRRTTLIADMSLGVADFDPLEQCLAFEHTSDDEGTVTVRISLSEIDRLSRGVARLFGHARQIHIGDE